MSDNYLIYENAKRISYNQGFLDGYKRGVEDAKDQSQDRPFPPNSIDLGDRDTIKLKILPLELAGHDLKIGDKTEFTWDEAVKEVKEMESSGWRLPTAHEWVLIAEELALAEDGDLDGEKLLKTMHCDSSYGSWWSSTSFGLSNAFYLDVDTDGYVDPRDYDDRRDGFSVRLVKEVKNEDT